MSEQNGDAVMAETPKEIAAVAKPAPHVPKMFTFVPKDLTEAIKYAEMVAASPFVPKGYVGNAGACLIAMQFGAELGLPPLQAIQNIAVINGKPGIYGDLGKALLYSKSFKIEERDVKDTRAHNEAWCRITRPNGQTTERTFSMEDAKLAKLWGKEGPWTNYPYRQMGWRAFWFAARDAGADVLKGIWGIEELQDYKADAIETTAEDAPKEMEPTPQNPVVDTAPQPAPEYITDEQRKGLVQLLGKHNVNPELLKEFLKERLGITDQKKPTAFIPKTRLREVEQWIAAEQPELDV